jgi:hypothetical protein
MNSRNWRFGNGVVILAALALLALPELVQAQYRCTANAGKITITGYTGPGGTVIIPGTITDLPVVSIGDSAFKDCSSLTNVAGISPFSACASLASITVAAANPAYSSMGGVLFDTARTTLIRYPANKSGGAYTIPESVVRIESDAFGRCSNLNSITIPASVTHIVAEYTFGGCSSLSAITVDETNPSHGIRCQT